MSINSRANIALYYTSIRRFAYIVFIYLGCNLFASSAYAESCWMSGGYLNFGTVNAQGSSVVSTDITVNCNSRWNEALTYKLCLVIDSTDPTGDDPRRMISYSSFPHSFLNYHLYYDPSLVNKIPNTANKSTAVCQTFSVAQQSGSPNTQIKIYGKVPSGQNVSAGTFQTNSVGLKLFYAYSGSVTPSNSEALANPSNGTNNMVVNANYENSCLILAASDIDFGTVTDINNTLSRSGTIQLACPTGTNLKVSLDNGSNASGSQRRMRNTFGHYLQYNLYQNANYSNSWQGGTSHAVTNQNISVYAQIPAQSVSSIGQYSDTITVTLTY